MFVCTINLCKSHNNSGWRGPREVIQCSLLLKKQGQLCDWKSGTAPPAWQCFTCCLFSFAQTPPPCKNAAGRAFTWSSHEKPQWNLSARAQGTGKGQASSGSHQHLSAPLPPWHCQSGTHPRISQPGHLTLPLLHLKAQEPAWYFFPGEEGGREKTKNQLKIKQLWWGD